MMKMETLCFVKITVRHEKKHRNSRIWPILAMPDFLAKVKRKLLQRLLSADTIISYSSNRALPLRHE